MKRRDDKLLKRTVVFQTVQPTYEDELRKSRVSTLTITEVDVSTTDERKAPKALENRPLGFGSTMKPLAPKPVFDYARAVGAQSSRYFRTNRSNAGAPYNSGDAVKANNDDMNFHGQSIRGCAEDAGKVVSLYLLCVSQENILYLESPYVFRTTDIIYYESSSSGFC